MGCETYQEPMQIQAIPPTTYVSLTHATKIFYQRIFLLLSSHNFVLQRLRSFRFSFPFVFSLKLTERLYRQSGYFRSIRRMLLVSLY